MIRGLLIIFQIIAIPKVIINCETIADGGNNDSSSLNIEEKNQLIKFAANLSESIDFNINPCEDFLAFACPQNNKTLNNLHSGGDFDGFKTIASSNNENVSEIIEQFFNNEDPENLSDSQLKMKEFYGTCKAQRNIEQLKNTQLYEMSGGWPIIEPNVTSSLLSASMDWIDIISAFDSIVGINSFFHHSIYIQDNKRVVRLSPNNNYKYSIHKYKELSIKLLMEYGIFENPARKLAYNLGRFERDRRTFIRRSNNESNTEIIDISYDEFKNRSNSTINWDNYFRKIFGKPLKSTDSIVLVSPKILNQIFSKLSTIDKLLLRNYIWIEYLLEKSQTDCIDLLKLYFPPVFYSVLDKPKLKKLEILQMFTKLGKAFDDILVPSLWIDEITQENSKLYINKIKDLVLNGEAQIDTEYESLRIDKMNFYENLERIQKHVVTKAVYKTSLPLLYNHFKTPFYFDKLPLAFSFGTIGESFANDIILGEKSSNRWSWRSFDSDNKLKNFQRCIIQQQENLTSIDKGDENNASNNETESILVANIDKIILKILSQKQSFASLEDWLDSSQNQRSDINIVLKDFHRLSIEKFYFILSTMETCRQNRLNHRELILAHLRNSREFTKTFKCPKGSGMRPHKNCMIINKK